MIGLRTSPLAAKPCARQSEYQVLPAAVASRMGNPPPITRLRCVRLAPVPHQTLNQNDLTT